MKPNSFQAITRARAWAKGFVTLSQVFASHSPVRETSLAYFMEQEAKAQNGQATCLSDKVPGP